MKCVHTFRTGRHKRQLCHQADITLLFEYRFDSGDGTVILIQHTQKIFGHTLLEAHDGDLKDQAPEQGWC